MHRLAIRTATASSLLALGALIGAGRSQAFGRTEPAAHAELRLVRAQPGQNDTLTVPPKTLIVWLSEFPDLEKTTITLTTPEQRKLSVGALRRGEASDTTTRSAFLVPVEDVAETGMYKVEWKAATKSGNTGAGTYMFYVAPHGAMRPPER